MSTEGGPVFTWGAARPFAPRQLHHWS